MPAQLDQSIYAALKELDVIDASILEKAYDKAKDQHIPFARYLVESDLVTDLNLGKVIADLYRRPFIRLQDSSISDDVLSLIPEKMARKQGVIVFKRDERGIHLATSDPDNIQVISFLGKKYQAPILVYYATNQDIEQKLYEYTTDIDVSFLDLIREYVESASTKKSDPPIIEIVNTLFLHAYENNVSDIHIESQSKWTQIRFRIDGILHDIAQLPLDLHERIVSRIKVLAKIRTDEHQAALDGKIIVPIHELKSIEGDAHSREAKIDVRVSIVPVTDGEKIVLRLLTEGSQRFSLQTLGFSHADMQKVDDARKNTHGMILVTGPTGSGKTTSLYSILKTLNSRQVNIMTIENPVEYDISGVNQIQVNEQTSLTFAKGLRAIVRQDPDIILVGEIRDKETAEIAVNSAMTGHLVLTTLHTNDAITTIPRLVDLEIDPFLISSTVTLIIAQRLVRKICGQCRVSQQVQVDQITHHIDVHLKKKVFGDTNVITTYQGKGCAVCHGTGYRGRIGIFEVVRLDDELRESIMNKVSSKALEKIAFKNGMTSMIEDGLVKVKEGLTTIDEILRVVRI